MSALGHRQTYAPQKAMSALPPNSDRESGFPHKVMSALPPKRTMRCTSSCLLWANSGHPLIIGMAKFFALPQGPSY